MSLDSHSRRLQKRYDLVFRQCVRLNTELHKLAPLVRQMHLLSANAVSSAARAGSEGDAFRVLTQDIKLLGDEVSLCVQNTQKIVGDVVLLTSNLAKHLASYVSYADLMDRIENQETVTQPAFFKHCLEQNQASINELNNKLAKAIRELTTQLSPLTVMVNKGEYLAVFSSVEAASAGEYGVSFEAVAKMLRGLVKQLGSQTANQRSLLREIAEGVEHLQLTERNRLYAS